MIIDTEVKYRPKSISDFVYANAHVKSVVEAYASGEVSRPLILSGTNGTGKSLLVELIPKAIEGLDDPIVNEIDGSDLNSANAVRVRLAGNKQFSKLFTYNGQRFGYNLIEELNTDPRARDALKVVLDDYRGTDLTIITTNHVDRVGSGLTSRCEVLTVPPCPPDAFLPHAPMAGSNCSTYGQVNCPT